MDNEKKHFSLTKAINMFTKSYKGDPTQTYEWQIIEENKKAFGITDADIIVTRQNLRAIDGTEALNQTDYKPGLYTENLRPEGVIAKTGCRIVDVDGPSISFGVAISGVNAGFVDLNNEIPSANMDWQLKTMTPKKMGCFVEIDYKALLQSRPSVEAIIASDITKGLDQCKDEAILVGDGQNNKPTGIVATSGVNEVPVSGAFTLSGVYGFEKAIRDSNDFSENLTWVMNSTNFYKYATTPYSAVEQNKMLLEGGKMIGYNVVICNALDNNTIILGNFNELLVANFDGMRLRVVEDAGLARKQALELQAHETFDCLVRRPKSFTRSVA
jgi:HK97 family phage major capsid protein